MKKNTFMLVLALITFTGAQAGILDWGKKQLDKATTTGKKALEKGKEVVETGKQYVDKGKTAYTTYAPEVQKGLTKGQALYEQHGSKVGAVIGDKANVIGSGLDKAQSGFGKLDSFAGSGQ